MGQNSSLLSLHWVRATGRMELSARPVETGLHQRRRVPRRTEKGWCQSGSRPVDRFAWPPCLPQHYEVSEEIPWASSSREHRPFQGGTFRGSASSPLCWGPGSLRHVPCCDGVCLPRCFPCELRFVLDGRQKRDEPSCLVSLWPLVHSLFGPCVAVVFAYQKSERSTATLKHSQTALRFGSNQLHQSTEEITVTEIKRWQ